MAETRLLDPELTKAWAARWKIVDAHLIRELRDMPVEVKVSQFAVLLNTARELGWTEQMREGEGVVRARWKRLREALGG